MISERLRNRFTKIGLTLFGLIVVFFVLNVIADNPYTHRLVRTFINEKVNETTNLNLDFQAIKLSLIPAGIDLYGFKVSEKTGEKKTLVQASHIKTRISFWSLVFGEPKLSILEFTNLESSLPFPQDPANYLKMDLSSADSKTAFRWPLSIEIPLERIALNNARLYFETPSDSETFAKIALSGLNIDADISTFKEIELKLDIGSTSIQIDDMQILDQSQIKLNLTVGESRILPSPFKVKDQTLDIGGVIAGGFNKQADGATVDSIDIESTIEGGGDLKALGRVFDIDETFGKVDVNGTLISNIPFTSDDFEFLITGKAKSHDGRIGGFRLFETEAQVQIDLDKITIQDSKLLIGEKNVGSAKGYLGFGEELKFDFKAQPKGLSLEELLRAVKVDFATINTKITSPNLWVRGQGDPFSLKADAIADFDNLSFPALDFGNEKFPDPPTCRLKVTLNIDDNRANFDGTKGSCFHHSPTSQKGIVPAEAPTAPLDALHVSKFLFSGNTWFDTRKGMDLHIQSSKLDLNLLRYSIQNNASGFAHTKVHVNGSYDDIMVDVNVDGQEFSLFEIPFGKVSTDLRLQAKDNVLYWNNLVINPSPTSIIKSLGGQIDLDNTLYFKAKINAESITPNFTQPLVSALTGHSNFPIRIKNLTANLEGPVTTPFAYQGNLALLLGEAYMDETQLFDSFTARIKASNNEILAENVTASLRDLYLKLDWEYRRKRPFDLERARQSNKTIVKLGMDPNDEFLLAANTFDHNKSKKFFDHLQKIPYAKEYFKTGRLKGNLKLDAKLQGSFNKIDGDVKAEIYNTRFFGSKIANIKTRTLISESKTDTVINHAGNSLEGRVKVDLNTPMFDYDWFFKANRLDLRALGTSYFSKDPRNYAYLSGESRMEGNLSDWWHSEGSLKVNDIRIKFIRDVRGQSKSVSLVHRSEVNFDFSREGWQLRGDNSLKLKGEGIAVNISTKGNRPPENLNLALSGYFDLELVRTLYTQIETASGFVKFEGTIKGSVSDPQASFRVSDVEKGEIPDIKWRALSLGFADFRPALQNLNFDVLYEKNRFTINSATADKGKGKIRASGKLDFNESSDEESRIDIALNSADFIFRVDILKSFTSSISGNLSVSGKRAPFDLRGDLVIDRARATREFDIRDEIIGALQRRSYDTPLVAAEPNLNLDLRINARESININNRNIQAVLSSNLNVAGTDVAPVLNGQVEINRGVFAYKYRRDFRITQGLITFDDPVKPDPRLDILGVNEIGGYRIYMAITGRASNPRVDLSADPPTKEDGTPLSKVDILVLLSTGDLPATERSDVATQSAARAEALNILVGQFEEPVEKLFDLSGQTVVRQVYIDTYAGKDGNPTPRLNFPLNLHQDWDVIFRLDENSWRVSLGYSVHDSIGITGSYDQQRENEVAGSSDTPTTDAGVDLKFRFAFP